jgi:Kef-type K+ transport system membrane component KefB
MALPSWSVIALGVGSAMMIGGLVAMIAARKARWERRFYWATWLIGGAVGSVSLVPRGIGLALATYASLVLVAIVWAFFRTNYIKIGDRIIAATPSDRTPDSEA